MSRKCKDDESIGRRRNVRMTCFAHHRCSFYYVAAVCQYKKENGWNTYFVQLFMAFIADKQTPCFFSPRRWREIKTGWIFFHSASEKSVRGSEFSHHLFSFRRSTHFLNRSLSLSLSPSLSLLCLLHACMPSSSISNSPIRIQSVFVEKCMNEDILLVLFAPGETLEPLISHLNKYQR